MSTPNTRTPADPAPLLAAARARLERSKFFRKSSRAEQDGQVAEIARGLAIYASDIGRDALRVGATLDALLDAVGHFMGKWEDYFGGQQAVARVLAAAGLTGEAGTEYDNYGEDHFDPTFAELNAWWEPLKIIRERLDGCAPLPGESEEVARAS